jgi:hypothetical protein
MNDASTVPEEAPINEGKQEVTEVEAEETLRHFVLEKDLLFHVRQTPESQARDPSGYRHWQAAHKNWHDLGPLDESSQTPNHMRIDFCSTILMEATQAEIQNHLNERALTDSALSPTQTQHPHCFCQEIPKGGEVCEPRSFRTIYPRSSYDPSHREGH